MSFRGQSTEATERRRACQACRVAAALAAALRTSPRIASAVSILVLDTSSFVEHQRAALAALAPDERIHTDPDTAPPGDVEALLAFKLAPGITPRFPALKFVACAGAGVDELLATPDLPPHVPDRPRGRSAAGTADGAIRRADGAAVCARPAAPRGAARRRATGSASCRSARTERAVGVMGYGSIGAPIVDVLTRLGYPVAVWTRTRAPRRRRGIVRRRRRARAVPRAKRHPRLRAAAHRGDGRPPRRASASPRCPAAPTSINVSRGAVLRERDLLAAVDAGHLAGAALDVFETEPLPAASPLWRHPKILCTPHIAAMPRPDVAARQFLDNLRRARAGRAARQRRRSQSRLLGAVRP